MLKQQNKNNFIARNFKQDVKVSRGTSTKFEIIYKIIVVVYYHYYKARLLYRLNVRLNI